MSTADNTDAHGVDIETTGLTAAQARFVAGLRELADLIERAPAVAGPCPSYQHNLFAESGESMAGLAKAIGGRWDKVTVGDYFVLRRRIAGDWFSGVTVEINGRHEQVCERVVTGTRTVEIPDPEVVASAPKVRIEEDVIEWRCPDVLRSAAEQVAA